MNLPELLTHLGSEQLRDLSRVIGRGDRTPSARTLLQDLIRAYRDTGVVAENLSLLDVPAREFLAILVRFVGRDGVGFHVPPSLVESWGGEEVVSGITETLESFGLLFLSPGTHSPSARTRMGGESRSSGWRGQAYVIPTDLGDRILELTGDSKASASHYESAVDSISVIPVRPLTYALLRFLALTKHGRVRITNSGRAAKRSVEAWKESLPTDSIPRALPFGCGDREQMVVEAEVFGFLLDFVLEADLARQQGGEAILTGRVKKWLAPPPECLLNRLFDYYVQEHVFPSRPHQMAADLILRTTDWREIATLEEPLHALLREKPRHPGSEVETVDEAMLNRTAVRTLNHVTAFLAMCGLVECGRQSSVSGESAPLFAVRRKSTTTTIELASRRALERHAAQALREVDEVQQEEALARLEPAILQPTFELMVPPNMPLTALWDIETFADFETADVLSTYRISRASYTRALRDGYEPEGILDLIGKYVPGALPQNVCFSLQDWGERYGQIQLKRGVLLRCQNAGLSEEIRHIPEFEELIEEVISDTVLLVKKGKEEELFERLERYDYSPRCFE